MALVDQIIGVESGGDANARNPNSSAAGLGQFIDSTWLSMLAKHRPDITGSPQDLIALKSDPELSKAMTAAYAADNGQILQGAGLTVTPGSTYLAHFAGPQGAVSVLKADPTTPVSAILTPGAIKANPFLQNMTAGDLQAWADRKMGGKTVGPQAAQPAGLPIPQAPVPTLSPQQPTSPQAFAASPQAAEQPQASGGSYFAQMPAEQMAAPPPILTPPRRAVDLSKLKAALASGNRGLFLARG